MERRGAERFQASSLIELETDKGRVKAEITDLSLAGCRLLQLTSPIARGDIIDLHLLEGVEVSGSVCWADGDAAGIKFAVPINMATLAYFRFAESITVTEEFEFDKFGRRLPPMGAGAAFR